MQNPAKKSLIKLLTAVIIIFALIALVLVFAPGKNAGQARHAVKRQWLILTGGMVDVGGYYLRIECRGAGSPTVVMDAGLGMRRESWETVPSEMAKFTRVCTYDRAGIGESDKPTAPLPRTSERVVAELHTLLQNAGEREPFLLVGHSFGGLNARLFANHYPQQTAGIVLVDSSHEEQYERYAALKSPSESKEYLQHEGGDNGEQMNLLASADELRNSISLPPVPLIVLSAQGRNTPPEEIPRMQAHDEMDADFARRFPGSKLIVVPDSGHFIQIDKPQAVIDAIRGVYEITKVSAGSSSHSPATIF